MAPDRYVIRPDAKRYEVWESYVAGRLGLGAAVDYALGIGLDRIWERVHGLGEGLRSRLRAIAGVAVHDIGQVQGGIVSFTVRGRSGQELLPRPSSTASPKSWPGSLMMAEVIHDHCPGVALYRLGPR